MYYSKLKLVSLYFLFLSIFRPFDFLVGNDKNRFAIAVRFGSLAVTILNVVLQGYTGDSYVPFQGPAWVKGTKYITIHF